VFCNILFARFSENNYLKGWEIKYLKPTFVKKKSVTSFLRGMIRYIKVIGTLGLKKLILDNNCTS
jgi:hypothetical protein